MRTFVTEAHSDQRRKFVDEPYVAHLERVMRICMDYLPQIEVLSAALLHDVLEDTEIRKDQLRQFLEPMMDTNQVDKTITLVEELTDVYTHERYPSWNRRKRKTKESERISHTSPEAQTIKCADIIDNCQDILHADPDFAWKFLHECRQLLLVMAKADKRLSQLARATVNRQLKIAQVPGQHQS